MVDRRLEGFARDDLGAEESELEDCSPELALQPRLAEMRVLVCDPDEFVGVFLQGRGDRLQPACTGLRGTPRARR
ncbi:hypothetical protein SA2016_0953 [Sinomonas atrocyanea]|uniref:Uncharacterized protein n=1 Tax=Sinomonas atrocyanea TaxID=37927 RepID=A0A126ZWT3_9MICC|nr:hypothetical protein SA2016_0953 [Sinomonas atrocyanea]